MTSFKIGLSGRLFLPVLLAAIFLLQALLVPKYTGQTRDGALIGEYYRFGGEHDVVFLGDCEVYDNFSPLTLWQEQGIPSCIRGSPQQTIWQSYYLLEDTLRRETPRVVVFNVLAMKYDTVESTGLPGRREAFNRMALEGMAWSGSKVKAIAASMTREEQRWEAGISYLFPILRYHDRWQELTQEDFRYWFTRPQVSHNGYLMHTQIRPAREALPQTPAKSLTFGENSWHYLDKMEQLCRERGIQLVLIKAPSLYPMWHPEWDQQMAEYAQRKGLLYINMIRQEEEIGLDWNRDTYDEGLHLNVYGAEKATAWLGEQLQENCGLPDRRQDPALAELWQQKLERYQEDKLSSEF